MSCTLCPRKCMAERNDLSLGFCNSPSELSVSRIMLHQWEEPCICRGAGAGAIFFSGCNLGCIYCQNRSISRGGTGKLMTESELEHEIFSLCDAGASCIEFITPTHYTEELASLLSRIKSDIPVPVVYNSGGYDSVDSLKMLDGLIDIYMPDFKYFSPEIAKKYSNAPNYCEIALASLMEMLRQVGKPIFSNDGSDRLLSGIILRHLILPSHRLDSVEVLRLVAREIGVENVMLSLMGQYTPDFYIEYEKEHGEGGGYNNLKRRLTSFEYSSVLSEAEALGFEGYMQDISSANAKYTPEF